METALNLSNPYLWLNGITIIIATAIIIFTDNTQMLIGVFLLFISASIYQTNLQNASDIRYVYEQFQQGHPIECGLWKGEKTIADPSNGWNLKNGRFINKDTVLTDPDLCSVIDKESPEISIAEPLILFFTLLSLAFLARIGLRRKKGKTFWSGKSIRACEQEADHAA
ncbi:hypothetical protein [Sulfuricurvum sp.]|uniref:hypothetical protein n=1 Tax=Sulfuricurvum sp. TaxID=2025608 RepID=UPI00260804D7|nr:hypothetical protein [Sulfuricurvum sp.]MDD2839168.1 hypothetical protein [Sulfuricurvum sp.]MDD3596494.1 hypothetical protein [Sulfuricurvum sp.]MDD4883190.1 hypothetical protein [Sulfuricurvum sp.]